MRSCIYLRDVGLHEGCNGSRIQIVAARIMLSNSIHILPDTLQAWNDLLILEVLHLKCLFILIPKSHVRRLKRPATSRYMNWHFMVQMKISHES